MLISTIMVCRNAAASIAGSVESFLSQNWPEKELVVVDGASTDGTLDILAHFDSPLIHVESGSDAGIYDAMNKGLARFRGDGFGFLNADDRYHDPDALGRIAGALAGADLVSGHLNFVERHGGDPVRCWPATPFAKGAFRRGWSPAHPVTYARRSVYERVGPFDPSFRVAGDYDWLLRALEVQDVSFGVVDAVLVDMAMGGVSTASGWRTRVGNVRELLRARQIHLGAGPADAALFLGLVRKFGQLRPARPGRS